MITKQQIQKASKIAEKNMAETLKTLTGSRLGDWIRYWNSKVFVPNKDKK